MIMIWREAGHAACLTVTAPSSLKDYDYINRRNFCLAIVTNQFFPDVQVGRASKSRLRQAVKLVKVEK